MTREDEENAMHAIKKVVGHSTDKNELIEALEYDREQYKKVYYNELNTGWENIDRHDIAMSVVLLDVFTKIYCRYQGDYERFNDLKFRCDECPFCKPDGFCACKEFKTKYAPDYKDFGSMGNL